MMYKFEKNQTVLIDGVKCTILDREFDEGPDYLCKPLDKTQIVLGERQPGASGWVREPDIDGVSK